MVLFHEHTSFLAANLVGITAVDTTKTSMSTSEGNFLLSTDLTDPKFICDTPLSAGSCQCGGGVSGLVSGTGASFPGSSLGLLAPGGVAPPPIHPSFHFAKPVTNARFTLMNVTEGQEPRTLWDAVYQFGGEGSNVLPSDAIAVDGNQKEFHKFCAPVNSWNNFKLTVTGGSGGGAINQTVFLKDEIFRKPPMLDPKTAMSASPDVDGSQLGSGSLDGKIVATGNRMTLMSNVPSDGGPPMGDAVSAVKSSSFAQVDTSPYFIRSGGSIAMVPERSGLPVVTSTNFSSTSHKTTSFDCCDCNKQAPKNPPGCHRPPIVTIHVPSQMQGMGKFL
jgi:hypothetical protein